jgi:hypothetical protein
VISDHNATVDDVNMAGTFFWNEFPATSTDSYDFFTRSPMGDTHGEVLWSPVFTEEGQFIAIGQRSIYIWDEFPTENTVNSPTLTVGNFRAGDSSGVAWDGEHLLASLDNDNLLVIYDSVPTSTTTEPGLTLGVTQYWITNPVPVTDGERLYVTSDFDHTLAVWNSVPDDLSTPPDEVKVLSYSCWDTFLWEEELYCGGGPNVSIWGSELLFQGSIGDVALKSIKGIAIDENYFYLADNEANAVYVWEGIPTDDQEPIFTLEVERPGRLSTNGEYLAVVDGGPGGAIQLFATEDFTSGSAPEPVVNLRGSSELLINLPNDVLLTDDRLIIASTVSNAVLIWDDVEEAIAGETPSQTWGATERDEAPSHDEGKLFLARGVGIL